MHKNASGNWRGDINPELNSKYATDVKTVIFLSGDDPKNIEGLSHGR